MVGVADPVRAGLVASLAHPGGNTTGNTVLSPDLGAERLQLLRKAVPHGGAGRLSHRPAAKVLMTPGRYPRPASAAGRPCAPGPAAVLRGKRTSGLLLIPGALNSDS
jgi:hypothetical protein